MLRDVVHFQESVSCLPAGAVCRLGDHILLRRVPGHALDVVPMLGQAPLALALADVPHHAHILNGACQQRCGVRRP